PASAWPSRASSRAYGRRRDSDERAGQRLGVYGAPAGGREHIKAITCRADEVIERCEGRVKMKLPRRQFLHLAAAAAPTHNDPCSPGRPYLGRGYCFAPCLPLPAD